MNLGIALWRRKKWSRQSGAEEAGSKHRMIQSHGYNLAACVQGWGEQAGEEAIEARSQHVERLPRRSPTHFTSKATMNSQNPNVMNSGIPAFQRAEACPVSASAQFGLARAYQRTRAIRERALRE